MWLSERAAAAGAAPGPKAAVGALTIGGKSAAVQLSGEVRGIGLVSPAGVQWRPARNEQVLVLETDEGERYILGIAAGGSERLGEGELCLKCGETQLKLGRDGAIRAEGDVHLHGDVFVTGRLFVNGVEIGGAEA